MKTDMRNFMLAAAMLAGGLFLGGCTPGGSSKMGAAIVPGADVVVEIDVQAIMGSKIFKDNAPEGATGELDEQLKNIGLTSADIKSAVFSMDIDSAKGSPADAKAAIAIAVAKKITLADLKKAAEEQGSTPKEEKLDGVTVLSDGESAIAISKDGMTLIAGPSAAIVSAVTAQVDSGKSPELSGDLKTAMKGAKGSHVSVAMSINDEQRTIMLDRVGNMVGPATGFIQKLKSISLGAAFSDKMSLSLTSDLGDADQATALVTMIKNQIEPMKSQMPEIAEAVKVKASGSVVEISVEVSEELAKKVNPGS